MAESHCDVCSQKVVEGQPCSNSICDAADRKFSKCRAIAMKRGDIDHLIRGYKYEHWEGSRSWATLFARLLIGYLDEYAREGADPLIVAAPTYVGQGSSTKFHHTEEVVRLARDEDVKGRWRFDDMHDPAVIKSGPTPSSAGTGKTLAHARTVAVALRKVLEVRHPERVNGQHVIVYDDVFTTGHTMNEVSRALRDGGARTVIGLVLTRQPWRS